MILVTGFTGHSGSWFLKKLIEEKKQVEKLEFKAIVRKTSDTSLLDHSGLSIEKAFGDLKDMDFLNEAMKNVDTVLHIAGIHDSLNVVKAAVNNHVKRLILVHTTGIYSKYKEASREYLEIEEQIAKMCENLNMNVTYLRPTMIYGRPSDNNMIVFIKMVDKLKIFPVVGRAKYELQPVYAKDLGDAYYAVLMNEEKTKNKSYNLSGKYPIQLIDIFKVIESNLGRKNIYVSVPFGFAYFGAVCVYWVSLKKIDFREKVQRLVETRVYAHEEATKDFGYDPVAFEEGVKHEIALYKERN